MADVFVMSMFVMLVAVWEDARARRCEINYHQRPAKKGKVFSKTKKLHNIEQLSHGPNLQIPNTTSSTAIADSFESHFGDDLQRVQLAG